MCTMLGPFALQKAPKTRVLCRKSADTQNHILKPGQSETTRCVLRAERVSSDEFGQILVISVLERNEMREQNDDARIALGHT